MRKRGNGADEPKSPQPFQTQFALLLPITGDQRGL
jgi:hypothetical protein